MTNTKQSEDDQLIRHKVSRPQSLLDYRMNPYTVKDKYIYSLF